MGRTSHASNEGAYAAFFVFKLRSSEWTLKIPLNKSWCVGLIFRKSTSLNGLTVSEGIFANDWWKGLEWYAEYLVFFVIQLQFATFLKQLNYSSRSFAVESRHNLLLLDLNTTQPNFCSEVKTQPPRNRVACSKIKVFTKSSPQKCSLLVDRFCWLKGEAVQGRRSF